MDAKVGFFLLRENLEDSPSGSTALESCVGDGLVEDGVDDLLAEQELAALGILNDVGNGGSSGGPLLGVGALEVLDGGENLGLAQGGELWI